MRILIVEDEGKLRGQLAGHLQQLGFETQQTGEGNEAYYLAAEFPFDAMILDLGLPGLSGIEVIQRLRKGGSRLPILVLTARGRWQEKVQGLEAGADDYVAKPFQIEELVARLRAVLRRALGAQGQVVRGGPLRLDLAAQQVWIFERAVELTAFEYRLLEYLMTHRDRVVSKGELADRLYAQNEDRDSNVVEVLVGRVRRKLDPDGTLSPIETRRGQGYRFVLPDDEA
ncbi:MAG: response regulator transcription factor [Chromatiaceae bacterium]